MKFERLGTFSNDIIFVDGLWGSGKSLIAPIVSSMANVESIKYESLFEHVSCFNRAGSIDSEGSSWLLKTKADQLQYYNMIGRDVNLRWKDESGPKTLASFVKIFRRLIGGEGDSKVDLINEKNIALCIMSHKLMLMPNLILNAFGPRLKVVEIVRHPLYMVEHYEAYLRRFDSLRDFNISSYIDNIKVPWFAIEWADEYIKANPMERAVLCISNLYTWLFGELESFKAKGGALCVISFENLVFDTGDVVKKLEIFTSRPRHPKLNSILKKQKLPRDSILNGRGHAAYGWSKSNLRESESYKRIMSSVVSGCGIRYQEMLKHSIDAYNEKYPSRLCEFNR